MPNRRTEGLVAALTFVQGASMLLPWPSYLLGYLERYGLALWWIALFMLTGVGMYLVSYLNDRRFHLGGWLACGVCWLILLVISAALCLPVALGTAVVLTLYCMHGAWHER